ncbi:MAG: translation initiation factor IF-2 [Alphaproteobacteria bacterium]
MSETSETEKDKGKTRLTLSRPSSLELKKIVESGQVRQNFSHGRSKAVTVEVRKKRSFARDDAGKMKEVTAEAAEAATPAGATFAKAPAEIAGAPHLTEEERAARLKALEDARQAGEEPEGGISDAEAVARATERAEAEAAVAAERRAEEDAARRAEEEGARKADETRTKKAEEMAAKLAVREEIAAQEPADATPPARKGRAPVRATPPRPAPARPAPSRGRNEPRRRQGRLTIAQALGADEERMRSLASVRRAREREKKQAQGAAESRGKVVRDVVIPDTLTVQELANRIAERGAEVIKVLMKMGVMATINQSIDADTAELVATEFGHRIKRVSAADVEIGLKGEEDRPENLLDRAPIVTVMGHVDHGKTSLLDALRKTDVVSREAGGITQHIGAYRVRRPSGKYITFLDTPGHEAFSAMRGRGAQVTDLVVLVVAADDSVMPQTIEAIHHARAAEVPIIVAINKIDKPGADANKVRNELLQHDIVPEEMGGDVLTVEISALKGTNLDKLEEAILLQAEFLELKANPNREAEGVVVEAKLERGRGPVATVLIERGTLGVGDIFVAGSEWGRVRALIDDHGNRQKTAGPSMPIEVVGFDGTPAAGDEFAVVENENRAREISDFRRKKARAASATAGARGTIEQLFSKAAGGEADELPVVIKADVQGSVEAIVGGLAKLDHEEVKAHVLHSAVGGINESDVTLAAASNALVIGFNVRANPQARDLAKRDGVEIRYYSVIYDITDDIKSLLSGMLTPAVRETLIGNAEIREVFAITKVGKVAGCMITNGAVRRGVKVRLLRDDVVVYEGDLTSLKRFKDEVREVKEGYECGMAFANYQDIKTGDVIECYEVEEVARTL